MIDLRSDTVTRPTPAMRRAMAEAEVGDDVYGEDPTVRLLEEEAAAALGVEAALLVPSGTMGNQIALRLHSRRGGEVICETDSHVMLYEMSGLAALSGLMPRALPSRDGLPSVEAVDAAISRDLSHAEPTSTLVVENTHNMAGGRVFGRERLAPVLALARRHGLPVHLDGARIFNAATALGVQPAALVEGFDSVMFCLSKGLGAPVGSLLCGSRAFVAEARRVRKLFGGGMRQAGVLAAAGLIALRDGPGLLAADHARARRLAAAVAEQPGLEIDLATVETNIVIFRVLPDWFGGRVPPAGACAGYLARLGKRGVLGSEGARPDLVRFVTHRDLDDALIDQAIAAVRAPAP
jgi:threonine aldolase